MPVPRLITVIGGLLLSKGGRRVAGRHAGKLALATLAYEVWRNRQGRTTGAKPRSRSQAHPRRRWSGRQG